MSRPRQQMPRRPRPGDAALEVVRSERRDRKRAERRARAPRAAFLAIIVAALLVSSTYPARNLIAKRAGLAALKRQSAELDQTIARLRAQRDALQTDAEVERLAREQLGMIRPGEVAFAVVPGQSPLPSPPARAVVAPSASRTDESILSRWWDALVRSRNVSR